MPKLALLSAGGTGGHLFPAQALARELQMRGYEVHLATDGRAAQFLKGFDGVAIHQITSATPSVRSPIKLIKAILSLGAGTLQARRLIRRIKPSIFIGFGGYPTVPPGIAARWSGVPVLLHEQNAAPGRANRLLAKWASGIARSLPGARFSSTAKDFETGNPVRQNVLNTRAAYGQRQANDPLNVVVFGGSQGAHIFSEVLPEALQALGDARHRIRLTMQVRAEDLERTMDALGRLGVTAELAAFFEDLPVRMAQSHLVIARAGASTVAELAVLGRPSILVPYPYALDHDQAANGAALAENGGALIVEQSQFNATSLSDHLQMFFTEPDRLHNMAKAAQNLAKPDATVRLANAVETIVGHQS